MMIASGVALLDPTPTRIVGAPFVPNTNPREG
jgi:hypothetical protein